MSGSPSRRQFVAATAAGAGLAAFDLGSGLAQGKDSVTIGWPSDVPSWDPNHRYVPDAQPLFKMVYDQPLDQAPTLELIPSLITKWDLAADGLSLTVDLRDDVVFHDGSKMTAADFRFTFLERNQTTQGLDIRNSFGRVKDIEIVSPTRCVMRFASAYPTAPQWLSFLGSYVVSKAHVEKVGAEAFRTMPMGTGPYKVVEYQLNSRIVLERHEAYWGPKPKMRRVVVEVIKDPAARMAALKAGSVDITLNLPVREVERLSGDAALVGDLNAITRVIIIHMANRGAFEDRNVRLAAHHAIDKAALSKAFYGGVAVPISVPASPGTPGHIADFNFAYDPEKAKALLAASGFSLDKPAKLGFMSTNGHFPSDYDMARAIVQMWKRVGIDATLEVIEYAKYFELNRGNKLAEATIYSWDNATGDPEIFGGYLLNPKMPFGAWKDPAFGATIDKLFATTSYDERVKGYRQLHRDAVELGATTPLLQSVVTVGRKKELSYTRYGNGWVLAKTMSWS